MRNKFLVSSRLPAQSAVRVRSSSKLRTQWKMLGVFLFVCIQLWAQPQSSPNSTPRIKAPTPETHAKPGVIATRPSDFRAIPAVPPFVAESVLSERDFPFLTALLHDPAVRRLLASDSALEKITQARWSAVAGANINCKDVFCKSEALVFAPAQIAAATDSLSRLYRQNASVRRFVESRLKPREIYTLNSNDSDEQVFLGSWERSAQAMNQIIATYCNGVPPRYSGIDRMTYDPNSHNFAELIDIIFAGLPVAGSSKNAPIQRPRPLSQTLFFEPTLRFTLRLLEANQRDEAGRYWPLDTGQNAAAIRHLSKIDWKKYRYSVLLIPGEGPTAYNIPLSSWGKERLRLGVAAYQAGMAPIFLLTGGFVHPRQTAFSEAVEMKKYLEQVYGLPPSVILIDPYARHTTTNLRNATREVFDYGLPTDRPMLIVSDPLQTDYIASESLHTRNLKELGYLPVILGKRLSNSELEATPVRQSEFRDPRDPLDP